MALDTEHASYQGGVIDRILVGPQGLGFRGLGFRVEKSSTLNQFWHPALSPQFPKAQTVKLIYTQAHEHFRYLQNLNNTLTLRPSKTYEP